MFSHQEVAMSPTIIRDAYIDALSKWVDSFDKGTIETYSNVLLHGNGWSMSGIIGNTQAIEEILREDQYKRMTMDDILIIRAITCSLGEYPPTAQFFYVVNREYRDGIKLRSVRTYFDKLQAALLKLPEEKECATLYRYINTDRVFKRGEKVDMSFASCSDSNVATQQLTNGRNQKIRMVIRDIPREKFRSIKNMSCIPHESECMILEGVFATINLVYLKSDVCTLLMYV